MKCCAVKMLHCDVCQAGEAQRQFQIFTVYCPTYLVGECMI